MADNRFARTQMLLGEDGLNKLKNSKIMIVGLGAVGGYVLEALARSGVGNFILVFNHSRAPHCRNYITKKPI